MIHYKDMTFCSARCKTKSCPRNFTEQDRENAREWWGNYNAPIAWADFSEGCDDYDAE